MYQSAIPDKSPYPDDDGIAIDFVTLHTDKVPIVVVPTSTDATTTTNHNYLGGWLSTLNALSDAGRIFDLIRYLW
jgi:hypothetical protein